MRILIFSLFLLTGCVSYQAPSPTESQKELTTFPVKPELVPYSRQPIISNTGKDYQVSDEFVTNGVLFKKYSDKIDAWKKQNDIK